MRNKIYISFLLLIAAHWPVHGQQKLTGRSFECLEMGGLCSTIISFVSDSIYINNHGCESRGYTFYGKYRIKADTLFLHKGITDPGLKVLKIDSTEITGKNEIELCFIDQHGNNLSKQFRATFKRGEDLTYRLSYDSVKKIRYYPKISDEEIRMTTLHLLGIKTDNIRAIKSRPMRYTYYLNIPDFVRQLDLFNKDILSERTEDDIMLIGAEKLIQDITPGASWPLDIPDDNKLIYKERVLTSGY